GKPKRHAVRAAEHPPADLELRQEVARAARGKDDQPGVELFAVFRDHFLRLDAGDDFADFGSFKIDGRGQLPPQAVDQVVIKSAARADAVQFQTPATLDLLRA